MERSHKVSDFLWATCLGWAFWLTGICMGITFYCTIIGIPLGERYFAFAKFALSPADKDVETDFFDAPLLNIIWLICGGFALACLCFIIGMLISVTIIGIPWGKQIMKLAKFSIAPFGCYVMPI